MAEVHDSYCLDMFTIEIVSTCDANITIPGSFPLILEPGANYFIGFTYITGIPNATGWRVAWTLEDDAMNTYPDGERPSITFIPQVPDLTGNTCEMKNGSIRGTVPSPSTNRQYNAIVTILQA